MINIDFIIGDVVSSGNEETIVRKTARAIVIKGEYILAVLMSNGTYKIPGGGVEEGEELKEALIREVKEETGRTVIGNIYDAGHSIERRNDIFEANKLFIMDNYYFICETDDKEFQDNEVFVEKNNSKAAYYLLDEVLKTNEELLSEGRSKEIPYLERETIVFGIIKKSLC